MFQMDIANSAGNQQMVFRNNQPQTQPQQQQQVFPQQYSYPQQQQQTQQQQTQQQQSQQPSYFAYNTNSSGSDSKAAVNFVQQTPAQYMQAPQQQMFQYSYPQQQQQQAQYPNNSQYFQDNVRYQASNSQQGSYMGGGYIGSGGNSGSYMGGSNYMGGSSNQRYHRGGRRQYVPHGNNNYGQYRQVHNSHFYNQQHHNSSNNAVPEKTPTLRVMHPSTKKVMSIKLNRIYSTMADLRPQLHNQDMENSRASNNSANKVNSPVTLQLCLDFLSPRGCMHGSGCDKVHVAGVEYMWEPVSPTATTNDRGLSTYEPGFTVYCYEPSLIRYYTIPSESITVTKGSQEYVNMFNEHGNNFKMKFKLCESILEGKECELREECPDIHCSIKDIESLSTKIASETHINKAEAMTGVPRLPAEMTVRVFDQNSFDVYHDYPGTNVLITEGAKTYAKYYEQEMFIPTRKRMQHCAHFRLKDMCRLGENCRFLHVLPTAEELQSKAAAAAASEQAGEERYPEQDTSENEE